jgi:4-amino-4-deoxy-L-arabinose transferase-like glycosyltransferase
VPLERSDSEHRALPGHPSGQEPSSRSWAPWRSYGLLAALTLACLVPFCEKAFHLDDTLFVWAAQQIVKHPLDPYGFNVVWYTTTTPMSEVTKNPPLASYYSAAIGVIAGWSEKALHLGFVPFALLVILGTYYLARRFTRHPLLAAAATLLTPAFLVSSTSVMCDTMMLALWILATILWLEGLDRMKPLLLGCSGLLIAACALAKYFGLALIPLLFIYSIARQRRLGRWAFYLLIPVVLLAAYQYWTHGLYHSGLLLDAGEYAIDFNDANDDINPAERVARMLIALSFAGGCTLPAITFIPIVWSRRGLLLGGVLVGLLGLCCKMGWIEVPAAPAAHLHWNRLSAQFTLFMAGGICILALAFSDWWKRKDADSLLLMLWVLGTFAFAALLNWTVNARSVLPLIPATGILLGRRVDAMSALSRRAKAVVLGIPLVVAGIVSLWVSWADANLAGSARRAAEYVRDHAGDDTAELTFQGHWGFQYYMESFGFHPVDFHSAFRNGTVMVIPENSANIHYPPPQFLVSKQIIGFDADAGISVMGRAAGAGFYSSSWGPLPYAFGSVPRERYAILRLANPASGNPQP